MRIKVSDLVLLEKLLLTIDRDFKFSIGFGNAYRLSELLSSVGAVTSYAFSIQNEHYARFKNAESLRMYHDEVMESEVEFDYSGVVNFILERLKEGVPGVGIDKIVNKLCLDNPSFSLAKYLYSDK